MAAASDVALLQKAADVPQLKQKHRQSSVLHTT